IFRGKDVTLLYAQLKVFFRTVHVAKPRSSRNSSIEAFIVCVDYNPPSDYVPNMANPLMDVPYSDANPIVGSNRFIVPFVACGDLRGFDADMTYPLDISEAGPYEQRDPTQAPISPPYKRALELKRSNFYNNTL
ncbi:putative tRNA (cytidine(32)/guanosine(34)-2'-O)-methyltransferase, partial [Coemansia sp. RSA 551]